MKKSAILLIAVLCAATFLVAADLPDPRPEWGEWSQKGDRLHQLDADTGIAKIHWEVPQEGQVLYEFNVRYESGALSDGHGGFGIHIFVDDPARGFAWGDGNSYLLWVNYDENPGSDEIPAGLSAQIYKSTADDKMELLQSISLKSVENMLTAPMLKMNIPVKLLVDGSTGMAYIYDPMNMNLRYPFEIEIDEPMMGDWVALRTNGISLSFGL